MGVFWDDRTESEAEAEGQHDAMTESWAESVGHDIADIPDRIAENLTDESGLSDNDEAYERGYHGQRD